MNYFAVEEPFLRLMNYFEVDEDDETLLRLMKYFQGWIFTAYMIIMNYKAYIV